ncbi:hypothetical protein [Marinobacter alkaliphilus]|uniref:hypothetical protein n=1 Tax=Marinobacter alkaliphilus TaxID=254719 RepID=UPI003D76840E
MEIQEMSFWELALEAIDAEQRIMEAEAELAEMQEKAKPVAEALNELIAKGIECGEIEPGRYQWGNDFLYLHENGTFSVQSMPRGRTVSELPGYKAWSDKIDRKKKQDVEG